MNVIFDTLVSVSYLNLVVRELEILFDFFNFLHSLGLRFDSHASPPIVLLSGDVASAAAGSGG